MSELYSHLLIPRDPAFVPAPEQVAHFFEQLETLGALPRETSYTALAFTGKTRRYARNPMTGEEYYGPEFRASSFPDRQGAMAAVEGVAEFDLYAEGNGPAAVPPFELYGANRPDVLWTGPYPFSVHCNIRQKPTHILHSALTCKCDVKPDEPGIFQNPWNNQPIATSGLACARFWIKLGIGEWLVPMITDTLEILDSRWVALARTVFGVELTQGCICNDD